VNRLESRFLLTGSRGAGAGGGSGFLFLSGSDVHIDMPPFGPGALPREGGVFVQIGSTLHIGVGQTTTNTVQVTDDDAGNVQAQWNGGPNHVLTGVTTTSILAERAPHDQITFNLTAPRTSPAAVAVGSHDPIGPEPEWGRGTAVQSGSVLTVMVTANPPKSNVVQIGNAGAGNVQVEWNGGMVHSFTGVATIVVNASKATKDDIILTDSSS
jgi:hypothetical protein